MSVALPKCSWALKCPAEQRCDLCFGSWRLAEWRPPPKALRSPPPPVWAQVASLHGRPRPHAGPAMLGGPRPPAKQGAQAVSPQRPSAQPEVSPQSEGEGCPQRAGPGSRPHGGRCGGGGSRPQCSRQGSPPLLGEPAPDPATSPALGSPRPTLGPTPTCSCHTLLPVAGGQQLLLSGLPAPPWHPARPGSRTNGSGARRPLPLEQ